MRRDSLCAVLLCAGIFAVAAPSHAEAVPPTLDALTPMGRLFNPELPREERVHGAIAYLDERAVLIAPIVAEGAGPWNTHAVLTNPAAHPAEVTVHFEPVPGATVTPAASSLSLPPGTTAELPLQVQVEPGSNPAELPALLGRWTFRFASAGEATLEVPLFSAVLMESARSVPLATAPVVIDGDLSEWAALAYSALWPAQVRIAPWRWQDEHDLHFRFALARDETHLYIAIKTIDDVPLRRPDRAPWNQDGIEIRIDPRVRMERMPWGQEFSDHLFVALLPADAGEDTILFGGDQLHPGIRAVSLRTEEGHLTEVAIPHEALDAYVGGPWERLRINIAIDDFDSPEGELAQYWWRPDWRFPLFDPACGLFTRNAN